MAGPWWGRQADEGEQLSGCRQVRSVGTSREAGHDTQAKPSFLQDKRQCKLARVRLLSESWFYRRADRSCGEMQVSLMVFIPDTCKQRSLKKKGLGF